jgi:hypothetical protein
MNEYVLLLFVLTATGIATVWFAQGLLNPFIHIVLSIIACALEIVLTFFFGWIGKLSNVIEAKITKSIRRAIDRIHIPRLIKALMYFLVGTTVFILDYLYGKILFNYDETIPFYHYYFFGKSYWMSSYAIIIGGFFILVSAMYVLGVILRGLNKLLDRPIRVSIVVQK